MIIGKNVIAYSCTAIGLSLVLTIGWPLSTSSQTTQAPPTTPTDWFRRADDLTDLRLPGSAPFHMKVIFRALPGIDFAKPGQSTIITGDGIYEETWLAPEKWRREVTLGTYHAVEARADGVRKFQATSDYEPSRVLMLLDALLYPVSRDLISPELIDKHADWKIEHLAAGPLQYVRLTRIERLNISRELHFEYVFLPGGILVRFQGRDNTITSWQDDITFNGKVVPLHFAVQAANRDLLTADVSVGPPARNDPDLFLVPGEPAEPGMTLRPFHYFEVRAPRILNPTSSALQFDPSTVGVMRQVIDRHGVTRELELIAPSENESARLVFQQIQGRRWTPPTIDESPCEMIFTWVPR
ncbi:MAG TPA: hypothetical protein VGF88_03700 [Acidobacteriaceae bacterium]|jgi:hypothetical protein